MVSQKHFKDKKFRKSYNKLYETQIWEHFPPVERYVYSNIQQWPTYVFDYVVADQVAAVVASQILDQNLMASFPWQEDSGSQAAAQRPKR